MAVSPDRGHFKIMWVILFLAACGVMIYQLVKLFGIFITFPTKTSVKLGYKPLNFPAVTICNMNPIRLSQAKYLRCELQKALEIDPAFQSEDCAASNITFDHESYFETEVVCYDDDECYEEKVSGLDKVYIRRERIADYLATEDIEMRGLAGHDIDTMLLECSVNGKNCDSSNFTSFLSKDLGNCYTYDPENLRAKKTGPETGLSMVINVEPEDFISTFKTGYGLRVIVHQSGTRPFPGSEGFTVSAGSETSIALKLVQIERLPKPYGSCNNGASFKKRFGVRYTKKACREFCERGLVMDRCNCLLDNDAGELSSLKVCNQESEWNCADKTINKYMTDIEKDIEVCECGNPCSEKVYQTSIFSRTWPILAHIEALEEQVCKGDPQSPKCSYSLYDFGNIDIRKSSFLKLKVYYDSLNFETVKEEPFYDIERFLSDIGGTMGLWMGASLLSLAEFLEMFLELLCCCFSSRPQ